VKPLSRVDTVILLNLAWSVLLAVLYAVKCDSYNALRKKYDQLLNPKPPHRPWKQPLPPGKR